MTTDIETRLDRMELRRQVLAQMGPVLEAEAAYAAAKAAVDAEHGPAVERAFAELAVATERHEAACKAKWEALAPAGAARDGALEAFQMPVMDVAVLIDDDSGLPLRCALTGLPILDGDRVLECPDTGERFLYVALVPMTPRGEIDRAAMQRESQA